MTSLFYGWYPDVAIYTIIPLKFFLFYKSALVDVFVIHFLSDCFRFLVTSGAMQTKGSCMKMTSPPAAAAAMTAHVFTVT